MAVEWSLLLFTVIAGAGAGMLAFAGAGEFLGASKKARFISAIIAVVLMVAGGCVSLLHLGNPINFMAAATNLLSFSPISLELIFLGLGVIVAVVYIVLVNRESNASKILGGIAIVIGAIFAYVSGHGYEVIAVKFAWATPTLTLSYLLSALTLGGFLFLALQVAFKDEEVSIKKIALVALIVAALSTILYAGYGIAAPLGDNAILFWIGSFVVGGLITLAAAVLLYLRMKNIQVLVYVGLATALIGGIIFRAVMWLAGSTYILNFFDLGLNNRSLWPF